MTEDTVLRVELALLRACQTWAEAAEGGWARRNRSIAAVGCDAGYKAFNQMFVTTPDLKPVELNEAILWYEARGLFRLRMRDDIHEAVRETVLAAGLQRFGGIPTMTMTLASELTPGTQTGLRVERATRGQTFDDHVRIVSESFDWQTGDLAKVFGPGLLSDSGWAGWVGYEGDKAVASSQLVEHQGVAGLYYVGTVKEARGKGYGEAITRWAIVEGQARGCDLVCLQASPMGQPVYTRIGFDLGGEYVTYIPSEDA